MLSNKLVCNIKAISLSIVAVLSVMFFGNCGGSEPQLGHVGPVNALAASPDGKYLFSAGSDSVILAWRISTGKVVKNFKGHEFAIHDLAISKDGKYLASASGDETARVWKVGDLDDIADGEIPPVASHYGIMDRSKRIVECCAITGDNEYLVTGDDEFEVKVSSLGGSLKGRAKWHTKPIFAVVVTADGKYAYSGSEDYLIYKWNIDKIINEKRAVPDEQLASHIYDVFALAISKDDRYIASAGKDSTIKIWEKSKLKPMRTIQDLLDVREGGQRENNIINALDITSDNKYILAGYEKNIIKVWDVQLDALWGRNTPRAHGYGHTKEVNDVVVVPPNNKFIASCSDDGSIIIWKFNPSEWSKNPADKNELKIEKKLKGIVKDSTIKGGDNNPATGGGSPIKSSGTIKVN